MFIHKKINTPVSVFCLAAAMLFFFFLHVSCAAAFLWCWFYAWGIMHTEYGIFFIFWKPGMVYLWKKCTVFCDVSGRRLSKGTLPEITLVYFTGWLCVWNLFFAVYNGCGQIVWLTYPVIRFLWKGTPCNCWMPAVIFWGGAGGCNKYRGGG